MVLWFLAELAALGVEVGPGRQEQLLSFVRAVQRPNGELPYALSSTDHADDGREHFQCFQYNAFQCLDLIAYHQLTADAAALDVIRGLAGFVKSGVSDEGYLYYDCRRRRRAVVYHAAAAAAALSGATAVGAVDAAPEAEAAYRWVLAQQRHDGGFPFSHVEFNVLRDRRSYPRNLAMILQHLLVAPT
jgi:prenyltransferase beta subunit